MEQIIIEGEIARHVRVETISETQLSILAPFLTTRLPTTLPVLPQHPTRYISFDPQAGTGIIVVETKPQRHHLRMEHNDETDWEIDAERADESGLSVFEVQLPFQYFAFGFRANTTDDRLSHFTIDLSYLFWAREAIRTPEDPIWISRCPNVDGSGSICWGSTTSDATSLSARIDDLINNFFTTEFNEDLGHTTPFEGSLTNWESNGRGNPLAYREWDMWNQPSSTLAELTESLRRDHTPTNLAELNPSFINIPPLPSNFTVARAQQWLRDLDDGARRRVLLASRLIETPEPQETEA